MLAAKLATPTCIPLILKEFKKQEHYFGPVITATTKSARAFSAKAKVR